MKDFVFVDTETTGLDHDNDQIVELSYAVNRGEIVGPLFFGVQHVPPFIDELIGFKKRDISGKKSEVSEFHKFLKISEGQTMVAANPTFDAGFLKKNGLFNFHYRMIDLSAFAMGVLGLDEMPGQADVANFLRAHDYFIPEPDHTSHNDVAALQVCFYGLVDYRKSLSDD